MKYRFDFALERELTEDEILAIESACEEAVRDLLGDDERVFGIGTYEDTDG